MHDSFNLFMYTHVTEDGRAHISRQDTKPGDYVDLLALMDVLAVPNVCGADIMRTSNFALKPLRITIFEATAEDMARVPKVPVLKSQRTPKDFRNATIKADRPLRRDPSYAPAFTNVPIVETALSIPLSAEEMALLERVKSPIYGDDLGAALRDVVFTWWEERFLQGASGAPSIETE